MIVTSQAKIIESAKRATSEHRKGSAASLTLKRRDRLVYGIGQMAEGLFTSSFSVFLFFYYNQVLGLSGALAGTALLIGLIFDAISDPLAGAMSDRLRTRWGRRHPLMILSAIPLGLSVVALFAPPDGVEGWILFLWLSGFNILARAALTLFYVPYLSLGAELSSDYHERNRIVAARQFFSLLGYVGAMVIGFGIFFADSPGHPNGQLNAAAYLPFSMIIGATIAALILISAIGTLKHMQNLPPVSPTPNLSVQQFLKENVGIFANPSFRALFLGILGFYAISGARYTLLLHMNIHFWGLNSQQNFALVIAGTLSIAATIPVWAYISKFFEKKPLFMLGLAWWCLFITLPPCLALLGILPRTESAVTFPALLIMAVLSGIGGAATTVLGGSMVADCVDEHELTSGHRQEGNFFGAYAFAGKALVGVGTWLGGMALDLISFPVNAEVGSVDPATLAALAIVDGPVFAIAGVLTFLFLTRYQINQSQHAETLQALATKRRRETLGHAAPTNMTPPPSN